MWKMKQNTIFNDFVFLIFFIGLFLTLYALYWLLQDSFLDLLRTCENHSIFHKYNFHFPTSYHTEKYKKLKLKLNAIIYNFQLKTSDYC